MLHKDIMPAKMTIKQTMCSSECHIQVVHTEHTEYTNWTHIFMPFLLQASKVTKQHLFYCLLLYFSHLQFHTKGDCCNHLSMYPKPTHLSVQSDGCLSESLLLFLQYSLLLMQILPRLIQGHPLLHLPSISQEGWISISIFIIWVFSWYETYFVSIKKAQLR